MGVSFEESYDEDLPWDPFWEYVLGEDELDSPEPRIRLPGRKKKTRDDDSSSILDYLVPDSDSRDEPSTARSFFSNRTKERDDSSSRRSVFGKRDKVDEPSTTSFDSLSQILGATVEEKKKTERKESATSSIKSEENSRNSGRGQLWGPAKGSKDEPVESASNISFAESVSQILGADDSSSDDEQVEEICAEDGIEVVPRQVANKSPSRRKMFWWKKKNDKPERENNFLEQSLSGFVVPSFGDEDEEETKRSGRRKREEQSNENRNNPSKRRKRFWLRKKKNSAVPVEVEKSRSEGNLFGESLSLFFAQSFESEDEDHSRGSGRSLSNDQSYERKKKSRKRNNIFWWRYRKDSNEAKGNDMTHAKAPKSYSFDDSLLDPAQQMPPGRQETRPAGNSFEEAILNFIDPSYDEDNDDDDYDDDEQEDDAMRIKAKHVDRSSERQRKSSKQRTTQPSSSSFEETIMSFFDPSPDGDYDDGDEEDFGGKDDQRISRRTKSTEPLVDFEGRPARKHKPDSSPKTFEQNILKFFGPSPDDDDDDDDEEEPAAIRSGKLGQRLEDSQQKPSKHRNPQTSSQSPRGSILRLFSASSGSDSDDDGGVDEPVTRRTRTTTKDPVESKDESPRSEIATHSPAGRLLNFFDPSPGSDRDDSSDVDDEAESLPRRSRSPVRCPDYSHQKPTKHRNSKLRSQSSRARLLKFFDRLPVKDEVDSKKVPEPRKPRESVMSPKGFRKPSGTPTSRKSFEGDLSNLFDPFIDDDDDSDDRQEEAVLSRAGRKSIRRPNKSPSEPSHEKRSMPQRRSSNGILLDLFHQSPDDDDDDIDDSYESSDDGESVPRKAGNSGRRLEETRQKTPTLGKAEPSRRESKESLLNVFDASEDDDDDESNEESVQRRVGKPVRRPEEIQPKTREAAAMRQSLKGSLLNVLDPSLDDDFEEEQEQQPRSAQRTLTSLDKTLEPSNSKKHFWRKFNKKERREVSAVSMASSSYVMNRSVNSAMRSSIASEDEAERPSNRRAYFWKRKKDKEYSAKLAKSSSSEESQSEESASDDQSDAGPQTVTTLPRKKVTFSPLKQIQRTSEGSLQHRGHDRKSDERAVSIVNQEKISKNKATVATGAAAFSLGSLLASLGDSYQEESNDELSLEEESTDESSQSTEEASAFTKDTYTSSSTVLSDLPTKNTETTNQQFREVRLAFTPHSTTGQSLLAIEEETTNVSNKKNRSRSDDEETSVESATSAKIAKSEGIIDHATELAKQCNLQATDFVRNEIRVSSRSESPVLQSTETCSAKKSPSEAGAKEKLSEVISSVETNTSLEPTSATRPKTLLCRSLRSLSDEQLGSTSEIPYHEQGIHFHELGPEELAEIFPKVCTVVDDRAEMIGNSNSFDESFLPARLQTSLPRRGKPQSIFEYEYESGRHMFVSYSHFGPDPRSLIKLGAAEIPGQDEYDTGSVLVQVEASTVSQTDSFVRHGLWWGKEAAPLPNVPGVDIAGKIFRIDKASSEKFRLRVGDRVVSLTKWGGNSRFLSIHASKLVKVPERVDPAQVACLAETYLCGFQILHHGTIGSRRYRRNSLIGTTYLILGPLDPNMARAISQLALHSGVETVYATSKHKHFDNLKSIGIVPLERDNYDWYESLKYQVDRIISFEEDVSLIHYKLLKKGGDIVLVSSGELKIDDPEVSGTSVGLVCRRHEQQQQNKTSVYDVYEEWEGNLECSRRDLEHLAHLLDNNNIVPHILDRIPLSKVPRAQELIESKRLSGFLVCEPWLVAKARAIRL